MKKKYKRLLTSLLVFAMLIGMFIIPVDAGSIVFEDPNHDPAEFSVSTTFSQEKGAARIFVDVAENSQIAAALFKLSFDTSKLKATSVDTGLLLKNGYGTTVGDEGGFAPELEDDEEALDYLCRAIEESGYNTELCKIALDCASGEWYSDGEYVQPKRKKTLSSADLCAYYNRLCDKYPIISIEDGLDVRDADGWKKLTCELGGKIMLVGDDLFVTNPRRFHDGIRDGIANSILVKPNQVGTLTEVMKVIHLARDNGYSYILSHRSGETEDTTIADIAVGTNAPYIKSGAPCRSERVAKYNRLLRIESCMNSGACYGCLN